MQTARHIFKKLLISYLVCFWVLSPLSAYSASLTPDGSTQTTLDNAPNGVPVVNIANPSASGLSHNRFTDYNVDQTGLILNNANTTSVNTQLGGFILGNAQLNNNVSLILNEVSSTNRTQLNGFTEIAGPSADLVIANPNGLSINGAGFINTNRVTLTTGTPVISGGVLGSLNVTGGDIAIQGAGLDTQGQTSTTIYTQYLNLNAKVHAQNLGITLGSNNIDYPSGVATSNSATNARTVLLDASALGGMYANRILLVGTDQGLGVNLPPEVLASSGDINISNNGSIVLQKMDATGAINTSSSNADVTASNTLYAGTSAVLSAANTVNVNADAIVSAGNAVNMAAGTINNQGLIAGGLTPDGGTQAGGAVTLNADNLRNNGTLQSTGNLAVSVTNTLDNTGAQISALGNATVQADTFDNSNGTVQTAGQLNLTTPTAVLNQSTIAAGGDLLFILDALNHGAGSSLSAGDKLTVDAANGITNDGKVLASGDMRLRTNGAFINNDTLSSDAALQLDAASLDNSGAISGGNGTSSISVSGDINNTSRISAVDDLDVSSTNLVNDGFFNAGNNLNLNTTTLTNNQTLFAGNNIGLTTADTLTNAASSTISADGDLTVQTTNATLNQGDLLAGGNLRLQTGGALTNNQTISAGGSLQLNVASLNNTDTISGGSGASTINVSGDINNASRISAVDDLDVSGANIINGGFFNAGNNLTLNSTNLTNNQTLFAGNNMALTMADTLTNAASATINADGDLTVQTTNATLNQGDLLAGGNLSLQAGGALTNNQTLSAGGSLQLNAASLNNTDTISGGSGASTITVSGDINNASRISAVDDLDVSGANIINGGFFNAGNNLTLNSTNLTNNQTLFAGNNMNLYVTGTLLNNPNANIFAMNNLTMAADAGLGKSTSIINDRASIETYQGNMNVYANSLTNRTDAPVVQGSYVATGTEHINGGQRLSTNTVTTGCGSNCKNVATTTVDTMVLQNSSSPATMNAGANLNLSADSISNQYSLISAGGNIFLQAAVTDNVPVDIIAVTTVSTAMYRDQRSCKGFNFFGSCVGGYRHYMGYVGTSVSTSNAVTDTVASTIQAGGSITGNVANLSNGNIKQNQTITSPTTQNQNTATTPLLPNQGTATTPVLPSQDTSTAAVPGFTPTITLPTGNTGLFIVSPDPQGQYLIETNPAFTVQGTFIGSDYLLQRLGYEPDKAVRLLGDALYENRLVQASIFAQTGKRFLRPDITSDTAQYQFLMDNALAAHDDLLLTRGVTLTTAQIAALKSDIVWPEEQMIAGQRVLVPVVYIADTHDVTVEGGKIIAGNNIDLSVDTLANSGRLQAGNALLLAASDSIINKNGSIIAAGDLSLQAKNDINNLSANMTARNIALVSSDGDITNQRYTEEQSHAAGRDTKTVTGAAGNITATENLALTAGKSINVTGSNLQGNDITLTAQQANIGATEKTSDFSASAGDVSLQQQSTIHLGSRISGGDIAINTTGTTTVAGSDIQADGKLDIQAAQIDVLAVNDSRYEETKTTSTGFLSKESKTTKHATSTNIGAQLSGTDVTLRSHQGDITVVGSAISANNNLALDSAQNIAIQAGFDGTMDETHTQKSGWLSGGKLYSKSEDLEGELTRTAALASLDGQHVSLNAAQDIALSGVAISAAQSLDGSAQNITVVNAENQKKTWSKHEQLTVGFGDAVKCLTRPDQAVKIKDGKASLTLAKAEISKADKTTTTTTVVSSRLDAGEINLSATSTATNSGNIKITGSDLAAEGTISLSADNDVTIEEAKDTENTTAKDLQGSAELKLTAKNEYVQIAYAVKAAKEAKQRLKQSKQVYDQYKQDLAQQRDKLAQLKSDLANHKLGIEQADVEDMQGLIDDLNSDDAYYKANIALATSDLASKSLAVISQLATAAQSSGTYGFSASLELDIDAMEKQLAAYQETSVASNLTAQDIRIAAGSTATIQGSNLDATNQIDIAAKDTNILASQDVNNSSNSTDHKHVNLSIGMYGGGGNNISLSGDKSQSASRGITNHNSQLVANNINITTQETTTVAGANLTAGDTLNLDTQHLNVASVQDSSNSRSNSKGFSVSGSLSGNISGVSANGGMSHERRKQTVLTTLTGNTVNINVAQDTALRGALIAAVDSDGNDNGQLHLTTGTLDVSSLNNTRNTASRSAGLNVGIANQQQRDGSNNGTASTIGLDYANDTSHSKTKTLGTLGSGTVQIANLDASNTTLLNRDVNDNEVDIYDISSHQGLKGTLDTRLLTEDGRNSIKEDVERSKRLVQAVGDVASKESFALKDTFAHIDETQKDLDVQKAFALANGGKGIEALQGAGTSIEDKQAAIQLYAQIYADVFGIDIQQASIIATGKMTSGTAYSNTSGPGANATTTTRIALNDNAQRNASDYANTLGHEVTHARIAQGTTRDRGNKKLNEQYANTMGSYSADGLQFSSTTYNHVELNPTAVSNSHTQTADDKTLLTNNNANWRADLQRARNGNGEVDYRELYQREANVLDSAKQHINQRQDLSPQQKQIMALQLNAVACAKIQCAEGVPDDDAHYEQLTQLQTMGDALQAKGLTLDKMLGGPLPDDTFGYGIIDSAQDLVTAHDEAIQRSKGAINAGIGTVGIIAGSAATVATSGACISGVGCLIPAGTAVLTGLAATQAVDGTKTLFGDYTSTEGQRVLDSFTEATHPGDRNLIKDAALDTALWVGETLLINKAAKLVPKSVKDKAKDLIVGGKTKPHVDAGDATKAAKYWNNPIDVGGRRVYQRNDLFDAMPENLARMKKGRPPIGHDGEPVNLHHLTQNEPGAISEVGGRFHSDHTKTLHGLTEPKRSFRYSPDGKTTEAEKAFRRWSYHYWKGRAK